MGGFHHSESDAKAGQMQMRSARQINQFWSIESVIVTEIE